MDDEDLAKLAAMVNAMKRPVGRPPKDKYKELHRVLNLERVVARINTFTDEVDVRFGDGPWETLADKHLRKIASEAAKLGTGIGKEMILDELDVLARQNEVHPVRDYLDSLEWDGVPRLDDWLKTYGDVRVTEENRKLMKRIGSSVLINAVRRVRYPGCKFDEALVLIGAPGSRKSTLVSELVPNPEWYTESLKLSSDPKLVIESTEGVWIAECPEMIGNSDKDIEKVKAFLSRRVDGPVRLAYGLKPTKRSRQFIVIGTTNEQTPIKNVTAARRFWPVTTGSIYLEELKRDRDQLWAEAAHRESLGEETYIDSSLWIDITAQQEKHLQDEPWGDNIKTKLEELAKTTDKIGILPTAMVWGWLGIEPRYQTREMAARLAAVMDELGYRKSKNSVRVPLLGGKTALAFVKKNPYSPENMNTSWSANAHLDSYDEEPVEMDEFERQEALIEEAEARMVEPEEDEDAE